MSGELSCRAATVARALQRGLACLEPPRAWFPACAATWLRQLAARDCLKTAVRRSSAGTRRGQATLAHGPRCAAGCTTFLPARRGEHGHGPFRLRAVASAPRSWPCWSVRAAPDAVPGPGGKASCRDAGLPIAMIRATRVPYFANHDGACGCKIACLTCCWRPFLVLVGHDHRGNIALKSMNY